jgi:hypothetical protein
MDKSRKELPDPPSNPPAPSDPPGATSIMERRRIGRIVHDERGNARLEWVSAAPDSERVPLSLEETQSIAKPERGYDPYRKPAVPRRASPSSERPAKRDLRKLSEWIKQVREIEARRQRGDEDEPD